MRRKKDQAASGEAKNPSYDRVAYARESLQIVLGRRSTTELEYAHCVVGYLNAFQENYFGEQPNPVVCDEKGLVRLLCEEIEYLAGEQPGTCCYVDIMHAYRSYINDETSDLHKALRLDRRPRATTMVLLDEITKLCPLPENKQAYVSPSSVAA